MKKFLTAILIVGFLFTGCGSENTNSIAPTPQKQVTKQTETPPQQNSEKQITVWGPGQLKVGSDIPAGEYFAFGNGYLEVAPNSSGNIMEIIMNDNVVNRRYITIYDGEYVKVVGDLKLAKASDTIEYSKVDVTKNSVPEGQYKVGQDIPAGEYKVQSLGMGYFEVSSDDRGDLYGIITNDNIPDKSSMYVTVNEGEYLKLVRATATFAQ